MNVLLILAGIVLLYFGAEWLVSGASRLALSLRISQLVVGLTVVAYGTSAPEAIVGVQSARTGHGGVALGNAIGSNIANLGLILALAVLVRPARVDRAMAKREIPMMAAATVALPLSLLDGKLGAVESIALLVVALGYTAWMVHSARSARELLEAREATAITAETTEQAGAPVGGSRLRLAMIALVGLGVLLLGGHVFVTGAVSLARALGMSERVVGLTIVAVGTSLPELATSLLAARKGHSDIAVGNVVGSNIFNIVLCLPAAALAGPVHNAAGLMTFDTAVFLGITALSVAIMHTERVVRRWEGALLLVLYVAFMAYTVAHPS